MGIESRHQRKDPVSRLSDPAAAVGSWARLAARLGWIYKSLSAALYLVGTDYSNASLRRKGHRGGKRGELGLASGLILASSPSVAFPLPLPQFWLRGWNS